MPLTVTFNSADTVKTISFAAATDSVDDGRESVKLTVGTMPTGVTEVPTNEAVVTFTDDVAVSFDMATYVATEGGPNAAVTVELSAPAPRAGGDSADR